MRVLEIIMIMTIAFLITGFTMAIVGSVIDLSSYSSMVAFYLFVVMLVPSTGIYCKVQK